MPYTTIRRWVKKYEIDTKISVAGKNRINEDGLEKLKEIKRIKC